MRREVQEESPEVGFVWGVSEGDRFIRNPDDDFRRISEDGFRLLEALASGEVARDDLEGTPRDLVERLESEGYLRPDEPVVRFYPPDDVRLWPRTVAFLALVALGVVVGLQQLPEVSPVEAAYTPVRLAAVLILSLGAIGVHEAGHYFAGNRYMNPSIRVGTLNGVLPAVITDTSGAWFLPRNRRRWITLAGPFVELCLLPVLVAVHYLLLPGSVVLSGLILAVLSHVLFSLNPLVHGDGYWLLTDSLGVVNLKTRGIEDLYDLRPTLAAGYVVASYGFAVGIMLWAAVVWGRELLGG